MTKIQTLELKAFRGAVETIIDFEGKSLVLHGENGCGKSSIVDALEFILTGGVSHLDYAQSTTTKKHAPHILCSAKDTVVNLITQTPTIRLSRTFDQIIVEPDDGSDFLVTGSRANFILRRKQLLDFIMAQPAGRYEQLAQIIGVEELSAVELNFKRQCESLTVTTTSLLRQREAYEEKLRSLLGVQSLSKDDRLLGLNNFLQRQNQEALRSLDEVEGYKLTVVKRAKNTAQIQQATRIQAIIDLIKQLSHIKEILYKHSDMWPRLDELRTNISSVQDLLFHEALEKSRSLIFDSQTNICPVCEQPVDRNKLLTRLAERLALMAGAKEEAEAITEIKGKLVGDLETHIQEIARLKKHLAELKIATNPAPITNYFSYLNQLKEEFKTDTVRLILKPIEMYVDTETVKQWSGFLEELIDILTQMLSELSISTEDKQLVAVIEFLKEIEILQAQIDEFDHQHTVKSKVKTQIQKAYELLLTVKQNQIQIVYDLLQADMQRYYNILHPGEEHREIQLKIKPKKRGSTDIVMGFHDRQNEDPRAYQSEGHLDSLGLCTFLAFVKHFNSNFPIIVLDDVVSTIDSQHRNRICELLYTEFEEYQLLITTHDYLWFQELAAHQRALSVGHKFNNLRVVSWSLHEGLRLDRHKTRWEFLDERLADNDKVAVAAHARRNLEWLLQEIAISTQTQVPIKSLYTVADLYEPVKKRMRKLVPDVVRENEVVFRQLDTNSLFGNLLIHNNLEAENASIEELRAFAAAVKGLFELVTCENDQLVQYHRDAKLMKCRCGHKTWITK